MYSKIILMRDLPNCHSSIGVKPDFLAVQMDYFCDEEDIFALFAVHERTLLYKTTPQNRGFCTFALQSPPADSSTSPQQITIAIHRNAIKREAIPLKVLIRDMQKTYF